MLKQTGLIDNAHKDLITDVAYDFYGLQLATAGLDQRIKTWFLDENTGKWVVDCDWKAHDAAVSKLSWAHPEFGTIIASSSFDRTVKIWEQLPADPDVQVNGITPASSAPQPRSRWVERAVLVNAKRSVRAVEFAPHQFGLKLATISSDNFLRTYECQEQPSLTTWTNVDEIDIQSIPTASGVRSQAQTAAAATPTQTTASFDGMTSVSLATSALQQQQQQSQPHRPGVGNREADGGWCLSWCKDRYWGEVIAVGAGVSGIVKIVQLSSPRATTVLILDPSPKPAVSATPPNPATNAPLVGASSTSSTSAGGGAPDEAPFTYSVTSVAWAPSCGRSFHLVATGSRDGHVRIWRVIPPSLDQEGEVDAEEWNASVVADFDDHQSPVTRVEWNITGTTLSSAGNDGRIRLWKASVSGIWRAAGQISVEQREDVEMEDDNARPE